MRPLFPAPAPRYMRGHTRGARLVRALRGWLGLLALGACADQLPTGVSREPHASPAAGAAVRLSATVAGTAVTGLSVTVTAADVPVPLVFNLEAAGGTAAGTVRVPPGPARTFTVRAFDARGVLTHEGARTVDVAPADNAPLALALYPRAGGVPLEVTLGSYTLAVAPAETTLAVGDTAVLTALVVTAEGDTLRDRAVWVTLDPTRATVRTTTGAAPGRGLVTARAAGDARVVATLGDLGAAALVHVAAAPPGGGGPPGGGTPPGDTGAVARLVVSRLDTDSAHLATDLWVADPDGPALRRLTTGREWDEAPAVAPGGRRVAFVRRAVSGVPDGRLWVVNADGTGIRPVFAPATRDALGGEDVAPAWSPDGRTLAFVSNRAGDGYRPYLADADGSNVRPVGTAGEERWRTFRTLSWAPDGTRLVAGAWHGPNDLSALAVLTLATGQATHVLSQSGATVEAPAWSPDGQRLLYVSDQDGRPQLYAATLGVADKARLVASDARDTDPTWAPDGARIAFLRRASGDNPRVFIVRADGSGARALTAGARWVDFGVAWR